MLSFLYYIYIYITCTTYIIYQLHLSLSFGPNTRHVMELQDTQDPLANSLLQPQFPGILVLELDWLPSRTNINDPLVLCIAGADSSFRLVEVNM